MLCVLWTYKKSILKFHRFFFAFVISFLFLSARCRYFLHFWQAPKRFNKTSREKLDQINYPIERIKYQFRLSHKLKVLWICSFGDFALAVVQRRINGLQHKNMRKSRITFVASNFKRGSEQPQTNAMSPSDTETSFMDFSSAHHLVFGGRRGAGRKRDFPHFPYCMRGDLEKEIKCKKGLAGVKAH